MPVGPWELAILLFVCGGPLLLGIVVVAALSSRSKSTNTNSTQSGTESALDILQQRYARGEIDSEEFEEKRRQLLRDHE